MGYGAVSALAYGKANYSPDLPEVGYAGRPNVAGVQSNEGVSRLKLNAQGFHDTDHSPVKKDDVFRVMVVGNSYSMAVQVDREDGYVARLGDELRACPALAGREVETINLGVDGYTIHQQFLTYRDYGLKLKPDFVLLQTNAFVVPGDLNPLQNLSPRLDRDAQGQLSVDYSYMNAPEFAKKASKAAILTQKASDASRLVQYAIQYRRVTSQASPSHAAAPAPQEEAKTYEKYRQGRDLAFHELVNLTRARNIGLAMTIIPAADSLSDKPFEPEPVRREWAELASGVDAPFLDVEEEARAHVRATGFYLHGFGAEAGSGHLNRHGNAFFAKALAGRLCGMIAQQQMASRGVTMSMK